MIYRFVKNQNVRFAGKRAADLNTFPFAVAQGVPAQKPVAFDFKD